MYIFQSAGEFIKLKIDRENKRLEIATSHSNYRFIPQPFWKLFGNPIRTLIGLKQPSELESKKEMEEAELLSDESFEKKLIKDMAYIGYKMIKK